MASEILIKPFTLSDWTIIAIFFAALALFGYLVQRRSAKGSVDYFLAGRSVPAWLAAISTIATMQSAATFLGVPDFGYKGDYTYLSTNIGALLGAAFVGMVLIPRFYAAGVTTVYEMLAHKYSPLAMRAAGLMFLIGRVLAEGSRIYLGAVAVAMIIFGDVNFANVAFASGLIILISFVICFFGGLKSVIWTDFVLFFVYVGAALGSVFYLLHIINLPLSEIFAHLRHAHNAQGELLDKTRLFDFSFDFKKPFSFWAIICGMSLLSIASFGLDQDITQRLLASKDVKTGTQSLYRAALVTVPIVATFLFIGSLLYVYYSLRPGHIGLQSTYQGVNISSFMYFILTEIPVGLRALAVIGVIATSITTSNSALNAMSSVMVQDFYRPFVAKHNYPDSHFVKAGMWGMFITAILFQLMSMASFVWQNATNIPLLEFVLGVMTFAYAGLLGVYFAAIFTRRGNTISVIAALLGGFGLIVLLQPYVGKNLGLPEFMLTLAFPWKLLLGAGFSFMIAISGKMR